MVFNQTEKQERSYLQQIITRLKQIISHTDMSVKKHADTLAEYKDYLWNNKDIDPHEIRSMRESILNHFAIIDYDIKSKDKYGSNLLHYYIMNYDSIVHPAGVIISEFIKKGLDINDKRKDGRTALYLSVQCQLQDIFEILLNSNADLDIQNVNGNTPLWEAVMRYRGDGFFIEQLLKNGANPDIKNNYGVSPKSLARTIANYDVRRFFNNDNKQQTD